MAGGLKRLTTAVIGVPLFFIIIKFLNPYVFLALICIAAVIATLELHVMARCRGIRGSRLLGAGLTLAVILSFVDERLDLAMVLAAAIILVPTVRILFTSGVEGALESVSVTVLGIVFIGVTLGYMALLMGTGEETGRDLTVLLFLVVWIADAGAYYVGSLLGKHPLSPGVSPNKTVEGAIGGLAMAVAATWVAKLWFFQSLHLRDVVALGFLLWAAGVAGDLAESLLKRSAAVKDCGTLFPGHGGMLDRTDSLLFGAPVLFHYYQAFMT